MLTVACLLWGAWPEADEYVYKLRNGVARHLSLPHRFVCMSDREIAGIDCLPLGSPMLQRNMRKMDLYRPGNGLDGRVLALDLDTVITGSLDDIASYDGRFCVLEDLWKPGLCGGGVIAFEAGTMAARLYHPAVADPDEAGGMERHWFRRQIPDADFWQRLHPGQIVDAKPKPDTIIESIPENGRVVCFHGKPRPHEVTKPWITEHWR